VGFTFKTLKNDFDIRFRCGANSTDTTLVKLPDEIEAALGSEDPTIKAGEHQLILEVDKVTETVTP
jgi:hypothetical protein